MSIKDFSNEIFSEMKGTQLSNKVNTNPPTFVKIPPLVFTPPNDLEKIQKPIVITYRSPMRY